MPRSFLVKKGRPSSSNYTTGEGKFHLHRQSMQAWSTEHRYPDISILQQHYRFSFQQNSKVVHLDEIAEPIDYSLKKKTSSEIDEDTSCSDSTISSDQNQSSVSTTFPTTIYLKDTRLLTTDGRSKRKETQLTTEEASKFSCHECGKHYATSSNLSRHKQTHRSMNSSQAKKCPQCDKVYVSMPALSMHILTHGHKHICTICDKAFSRPWLLQGHMRSHTGERPYDCAYCPKKFADRSNLRAHMQTHAEEKEYKCSKCSKTFAVKSYLAKHIESCSSPEDENKG